jgi:hypothetical protein
MNFNDAVAILAPDLSKWTRAQRTDAICAAIKGTRLGPLEAVEIIGVLIEALKYDHNGLGEIEREAESLKEALEEFAHEMSMKEVDECAAWHDWQARHDEP